MSPTAAAAAETVIRVPRAQLIPCPLNPRTRFEESALQELGASLREKGVIQPLLTRLNGATGLFEIVDGERRWRGAELAGVDELPVIVRELSDSDVLEIAIVSAVQRQGLTPLEEAAGYRRLIDSNPSHYSARYIADRIGRNEKYVWDRMKLLDLVGEAKQLLNDERILVGHAELLAKLKPEDQHRAMGLEWYGDQVSVEEGGLFERSQELDLFTEDEADRLAERDPFRGMKVRTVRELEAWIAKHVRFDVQHFATAAPLDFGPVSDRVAAAAAKPGRGKKVVAITHDYHIDDAAKADGERTYGPRAWRRADGQKASERCDHALLGVVAVGPDYGQAFDVCIARDKCEVHWREEIEAKRTAEKLRAEGKTTQAKKTEQRAEQSWEKQEAERRARERVWKAIYPRVLDEVRTQVKRITKITPALAAAVQKVGCSESFAEDAHAVLGVKWFESPAAAIVAVAAMPNEHEDCWHQHAFDTYVARIKPLGLDMKRLNAVRDDVMCGDEPAPATAAKKKAAAKPAKKSAPKKASAKKPVNKKKR